MATIITVYSRPACVQCNATYRALDKIGLKPGAGYTVIDISEDADAREYVMGLGHQQAPVVVVTDGSEIDHWSGYRPDRITTLGGAIAVDTVTLAA